MNGTKPLRKIRDNDGNLIIKHQQSIDHQIFTVSAITSTLSFPSEVEIAIGLGDWKAA